MEKKRPMLIPVKKPHKYRPIISAGRYIGGDRCVDAWGVSSVWNRYSWKATEWTECRVDTLLSQQDRRRANQTGLCGGGIQGREVYCVQAGADPPSNLSALRGREGEHFPACNFTHTCAHTHTRTHARTHAHTRAHTHTHARAHARMQAGRHVCTHARTHARMHTRTKTRTHTRIHTHTHTHFKFFGRLLATASIEKTQ